MKIWHPSELALRHPGLDLVFRRIIVGLENATTEVFPARVEVVLIGVVGLESWRGDIDVGVADALQLDLVVGVF